MATKADLQRIRQLKEKKYREAQGLFVVEGEKVISELLAAGYDFLEIYGTKEWAGKCTHRLTDQEMARASHFPTPSCVLAIGRIKRAKITTEEFSTGLTFALDDVQDPGNVGTIIRIADWFGFARVVLSNGCADLFHQKAINASMGSFARVLVYNAALAGLLENVNAEVYGCALAGTNVNELQPSRNAIFVIGSEGRGLSLDVSKNVNRFITIPRRGSAESLNAAIAAGIIAANAVR